MVQYTCYGSIDALAVDTLESQANAKALETFLGGVESAASFYLAAKSGDIRGATLTFANSFSSSLATGAVAVTNIYTTNQLAKRINNIILAKKLLYLRYFGEYAEPEIYQQYGLDIAVNNFDDLLSELSVNESLFPVGSICPSSDAPDLPRATYFVAFGITGYVLCSVSEAIVIDYDAAQVESIFNRYETNFENWAFARATANQSIYIDIDNDGIANKLDSHPNNSELPVQIVNLEPVAVITPSSRSVELNTEVYLDGESSYDQFLPS